MSSVAAMREKIVSGSVSAAELLPLLTRESLAERAQNNAELARAYAEAGDLHQASLFSKRALQLSGFAETFLADYLHFHRALNNTNAIRYGHTQAGMRHAQAGDVEAAIRHFNLAHYAHLEGGRGDHFEYDYEVLRTIENLAAPFRFLPPTISQRARRIRIAYLVFGASHRESVLIKILCYFARYHDRERFEIAFFVPDRVGPKVPPDYVAARQNNICKLTESGGKVIAATASHELDAWKKTAQDIYAFGADILVTTALLADYSHYFISATRPAPVLIGLQFGPPEQYAAPLLDWAIAANRHSLIDSPCNCSHVKLEVELPERGALVPHARSDFEIPASACVVLCAGRKEKFLDPEYWAAVFEVLRQRPDAFLLLVGLDQVPEALQALIAAAGESRVKVLGWRTDYQRLLTLADIVIDTFPSGGGVTLMDAMALDIPVLTFRNNYLRPFSQTEWSPADEFVLIPDLVLQRRDYRALMATLSRLIGDAAWRAAMGAACRENILREKSQPQRTVRRHEAIYEQVHANISARRNQKKNGARPGFPTPTLVQRIFGRLRKQ